MTERTESTMTDETLSELERPAKEATPGPWEYGHQSATVQALPEYEQIAHCMSVPGCGMLHDMAVVRANARFIAASRTAVPALLAALREARGERDELAAAIDAACKKMQEIAADPGSKPIDVCGWCGAFAPLTTTDLKAHIEACPKNSVLQRALAAEAAHRRVLALLDPALARAEAAEKALRELLAVCWPTPDEGHTGFVDRLGMQFYRETRIWPPFKSEPMEIARPDVEREEASKAWRTWLDKKRDAAATQAATVLAALSPQEPRHE